MNTEKKMYTCSLCGMQYTKVTERASCELACAKKQEEEAKKAAEAKKHAEQPSRKTEVDEAFATAYKLRDKYVADYGAYSYVHNELSNATVGDIFKLFM